MSAVNGAALEAGSDPVSKRRIVYLIHDVYDPAIERRVRMLIAGGASLVLAGFRRRRAPVGDIAGVPVIDLGRTHDAKLAARALSVAGACFSLGPVCAALKSADVLMARNLEMLILARAAVRQSPEYKGRLIYECLDIHRAMVGKSAASASLRALERVLLQSVDLLVVSSPAFIEHYFKSRQKFEGAWLLLENKVLALQPSAQRTPIAPGPPWRIGWFGVLRCQRSLDMLTQLADAAEGRYEVLLRGRPAHHEFTDFAGQVAAASHVEFLGPYEPTDIGRHYSDIHLAWGLDFFDIGANSEWLLPNRLYEAGAHGVPCLVREETEAGRWVARTGAGVPVSATVGALDAIDCEVRRYRELAARVAEIAPCFVADADECSQLVLQLKARAFSE